MNSYKKTCIVLNLIDDINHPIELEGLKNPNAVEGDKSGADSNICTNRYNMLYVYCLPSDGRFIRELAEDTHR